MPAGVIISGHPVLLPIYAIYSILVQAVWDRCFGMIWNWIAPSPPPPPPPAPNPTSMEWEVRARVAEALLAETRARPSQPEAKVRESDRLLQESRMPPSPGSSRRRWRRPSWRGSGSESEPTTQVQQGRRPPPSTLSLSPIRYSQCLRLDPHRHRWNNRIAFWLFDPPPPSFCLPSTKPPSPQTSSLCRRHRHHLLYSTTPLPIPLTHLSHPPPELSYPVSPNPSSPPPSPLPRFSPALADRHGRKSAIYLAGLLFILFCYF